MVDKIAVVVLLPCAPATEKTSLSAKRYLSASLRRKTGMERLFASIISSLSSLMIAERLQCMRRKLLYRYIIAISTAPNINTICCFKYFLLFGHNTLYFLLHQFITARQRAAQSPPSVHKFKLPANQILYALKNAIYTRIIWVVIIYLTSLFTTALACLSKCVTVSSHLSDISSV
jgi:hypothetical protein